MSEKEFVADMPPPLDGSQAFLAPCHIIIHPVWIKHFNDRLWVIPVALDHPPERPHCLGWGKPRL